MKRIVGLLVAVAALTAAGSASAALPATPGVAFVSEGTVYPSDGYVTFGGGPLTQNNITATVNPEDNVVTFDAPNALILPDPVDTAIYVVNATDVWSIIGSPAPKDGPGNGCAVGVIGHTSCDSWRACYVSVTGNVGRDTIRVRYLAPARTAEYPPVPCGFTVNGDRGDDTIDTRDGVWSRVVCGGAIDHVVADIGDEVAADCEFVSRG